MAVDRRSEAPSAQGLFAEQAAAQASFGDLEGWMLRSSQGPRAIANVYEELNGELR